MEKTVDVVLVGLRNYGTFYRKALYEEGQQRGLRFVAGVDPAIENPDLDDWDALRRDGVELYANIDTFFASERAALAILSSPIHLHADQACAFIERGIPVLCEKPVAATVQEALRMKEADASSTAFIAIGYQWSYANSIQSLKADVGAGRFGKPLRMRTLVLWPRNRDYYARNNWAGRVKDDAGRWVLDSPINNATAHYLHNCFYLLGAQRETSAPARCVTAELYCANPIENFDTAALRCITEDGVKILFYATHAVEPYLGPIACYEFEGATVFYEARPQGQFVAHFHDGPVVRYGSPESESRQKLWDAADAVRDIARVACPVEAALPHLICVNGAQESMPEIRKIPSSCLLELGEGGNTVTAIKGIAPLMIQCFGQGILPSEHGGESWTAAGETVDLEAYRRYPR